MSLRVFWYLIIIGIIGLNAAIISCCNNKKLENPTVAFNPNLTLGTKGLHGYIAYDSPKSPDGYGAGVSFYTAVWPLINTPLENFQIGLPGTWITPDNRDNKDIPLCPIGTYARDNWDPRGPTYESVFQTLEGGLGYWAGNKYRYGPPKFMMNATSQCYDFEIATPGWSFFYDDETLQTDRLGIAQLSNRIIIPPDAMTFEGNPNGKFMGYSYMALPITEAYEKDGHPTGDQSWTCFINTENFKGPIAYYLPETWSKISKDYPIINGRGLDAKPGIINGGAMEINTVPHYEAISKDSTKYIKIPQLKFPVDNYGNAQLVKDLCFYNKEALYDVFKNWKDGKGKLASSFGESGQHRPTLKTKSPKYDQGGIPIDGIDDYFKTNIYSDNSFGLQWNLESNTEKGLFPKYYKEVNGKRIPIAAEAIPKETGLLNASFPDAKPKPPYTSPQDQVWNNDGKKAGPFEVTLNDGSKVTYYWYKFIEQPVFQQFDWSEEKKQKIQSIVERLHGEWLPNKEYITPMKAGKLVSLDKALLVLPPAGLERGYVPIVTHQDK